MAFMIVEYKSRAALLQGEQRDSAVNINAYRVLQRHRAVSLMQQGFLVYISRPFKCWNYSRPIADFYGRDAKVTTISPKSRTAQDQNHGKSHGDREYVIIHLQKDWRSWIYGHQKNAESNLIEVDLQRSSWIICSAIWCFVWIRQWTYKRTLSEAAKESFSTGYETVLFFSERQGRNALKDEGPLPSLALSPLIYPLPLSPSSSFKTLPSFVLLSPVPSLSPSTSLPFISFRPFPKQLWVDELLGLFLRNTKNKTWAMGNLEVSQCVRCPSLTMMVKAYEVMSGGLALRPILIAQYSCSYTVLIGYDG